MYLPSLTDRELARYADITFDRLTATDLQVELAKRFAANLDQVDAWGEVEKMLDDHGVEISKSQSLEWLRDALQLATDTDSLPGAIEGARALLDVLREFDIDSPDELKKILDRDAKVADLMNDLAQPLASLQALVTPA